jgi:hypothetical protein
LAADVVLDNIEPIVIEEKDVMSMSTLNRVVVHCTLEAGRSIIPEQSSVSCGYNSSSSSEFMYLYQRWSRALTDQIYLLLIDCA